MHFNMKEPSYVNGICRELMTKITIVIAFMHKKISRIMIMIMIKTACMWIEK